MQLENKKDEKQEPLFSEYYDKVDRTHEKIMESVAKLNRSKKSGFTKTDRIEAIRELVKDTDYNEIYIDTASIWTKKSTLASIDSNKEYVLISSHSDVVPEITKCYSKLSEHGYYEGTYDNQGTNAVAVMSMLESDFPDNVIFAFTADEETGHCSGARNTIKFLDRLGIKNITCVALDVTYEGYNEGKIASIENTNKDKDFLNRIAKCALQAEPDNQETFCYVRKSKKGVSEDLPKSYISSELGMMDEAFVYDDLGKNTFSLCLPSKGSMHSNSGLTVRQPVLEGYLMTLETMVYGLTKTHENLIEQKKIEKETLMNRITELLTKEEAKRKETKSYQNSWSGGMSQPIYNSNYWDDYMFGNYENSCDYDENILANYLGYEDSDVFDEIVDEYMCDLLNYDPSMNINTDEETKAAFVDDVMRTAAPDLCQQYEALQILITERLNEYLESAYDEELEDKNENEEAYKQLELDEVDEYEDLI